VARQKCHGTGTGEGTFDWGALNEKWIHPNTDIEWPKWDFGPTSVILYQNSFSAVAYMREWPHRR
jgi:hypothetical protein